jgi:hypothetical protein
MTVFVHAKWRKYVILGGNWQTVDYVMQLAKYVHQCNIMNVMYYAILRNFQSSFNYLSGIIVSPTSATLTNCYLCMYIKLVHIEVRIGEGYPKH